MPARLGRRRPAGAIILRTRIDDSSAPPQCIVIRSSAAHRASLARNTGAVQVLMPPLAVTDPPASVSGGMTSTSTLVGTASTSAAGGLSSPSSMTGTAAAVTQDVLAPAPPIVFSDTDRAYRARAFVSTPIVLAPPLTVATPTSGSGGMTSTSTMSGAATVDAGVVLAPAVPMVISDPGDTYRRRRRVDAPGFLWTPISSDTVAGPSGGMTSSSTLAGTASRTDPATGGLSSTSTLTGTAVTGAAGGLSSSSVLAGTASRADTVAGGLNSSSQMTGDAATASTAFLAPAVPIVLSDPGDTYRRRRRVDAPGFLWPPVVAADATTASGGFTSTSTLTGAASRTDPATGGFTSTSALAGTAAVAGAAVGGLSSTSALTGSAFAVSPVVAGLMSSSSLTGTAARADAITGGLVSTSAMTGTIALGATGGFASTSTLAGTATAAPGRAGSFTSTSTLAGAAAAIAPALPDDITLTVSAPYTTWAASPPRTVRTAPIRPEAGMRADSIEYVWVTVTGTAGWIGQPVAVSVDDGATWVTATVDLDTVKAVTLPSGEAGQSAAVRVLATALGAFAPGVLPVAVQVTATPEVPRLDAGWLLLT